MGVAPLTPRIFPNLMAMAPLPPSTSPLDVQKTSVVTIVESVEITAVSGFICDEMKRGNFYRLMNRWHLASLGMGG